MWGWLLSRDALLVWENQVCKEILGPHQGGTRMVNELTGSRPRLRFTGGGRGLAVHAGTRLLADLADNTGLTAALSEVMASTKVRDRGHDRGRVLADAAVMIADGGEAISDIAALGCQRGLFGEVASLSTLWRTLDAAGGRVEQIKAARATARRAVWAAGADPGFYVIDIDATLVDSHSNKQGAAGTYKGGFGFHPLMAYLDATGEALAGLLGGVRCSVFGGFTCPEHGAVEAPQLVGPPLTPVWPRRLDFLGGAWRAGQRKAVTCKNAVHR